jgi:hypothetical protein
VFSFKSHVYFASLYVPALIIALFVLYLYFKDRSKRL